MEDELERQRGFDGEIGILPLLATRANAHGLPGGDRIRGQPHVISPRWTSARSYADQFPTWYFVLYFGCTLDFMSRSCACRRYDGQDVERGSPRAWDPCTNATVWGVGEWTTQMFLIFKLGRPDVMPAGDLGVQEGLRILDGLDERPTPEILMARSEVWRPLRSLAAWYLWRLTDEP